jgi:alanine dehydrogenase
MAREDAHGLGVIGTGRQARTQVEAIAAVRRIDAVKVFGRDEARREKFCDDIRSRLKLNAVAVASGEDAIRTCDIAVTATTSTVPVLLGEWLKPGTHINAIGANYEYRRELDVEAVARAAIVAADDLEQVRYESSDLGKAVEEKALSWDRVHGLGDIVAGTTPGRKSANDITLFKSLGVAIEDVALSIRAYEKAKQQGLGRALPDLAG